MHVLKGVLALTALAFVFVLLVMTENARATIICGAQGRVLTLLQNTASWRTREVKYYVGSQPLGEVYYHLAGLAGFNVALSDKLSAPVKSRLISGTIVEILDKLSADYATSWFIDDNVLHVSALSENITQSLPSGKIDERGFCQNLRQQGLDGTGARIVINEKEQRVEITASRDFIASVVDQLVPEVIEDKSKGASESAIAVVRFGKVSLDN